MTLALIRGCALPQFFVNLLLKKSLSVSSVISQADTGWWHHFLWDGRSTTTTLSRFSSFSSIKVKFRNDMNSCVMSCLPWFYLVENVYSPYPNFMFQRFFSFSTIQNLHFMELIGNQIEKKKKEKNLNTCLWFACEIKLIEVSFISAASTAVRIELNGICHFYFYTA